MANFSIPLEIPITIILTGDHISEHSIDLGCVKLREFSYKLSPLVSLFTGVIIFNLDDQVLLVKTEVRDWGKQKRDYFVLQASDDNETIVLYSKEGKVVPLQNYSSKKGSHFSQGTDFLAVSTFPESDKFYDVQTGEEINLFKLSEKEGQEGQLFFGCYNPTYEEPKEEDVYSLRMTTFCDDLNVMIRDGEGKPTGDCYTLKKINGTFELNKVAPPKD